jgi:hypothetical protein
MMLPESVYAHTMIFEHDDAALFERRLAPYGEWPPADVAMREVLRLERTVTMRNLNARRAPAARLPVIARPRACSRPREQRHRCRRRVTRGSPPDDPSELPPPDSDLNLVWREALDRFETAEEFRTLGRLAAIRARGLRWAA